MAETYFIIPEVAAQRPRRGRLPPAGLPRRRGRRRRPPLRRGLAPRHPHAQRHQGPPPRPPLRLRLEGLRARGPDRGDPVALRRRARIWNANSKLGQATAYRAMDAAIELADRYGVGTVCVDNAFHYLWGGGYVMDAARRGYIAYTNCTAALAEVVPFGGRFPTLGTNPHSWGFPTTAAVGFPVVIDWATSVIAMGRVQQLKREGRPLPPMAALDRSGNPTTDPAQAVCAAALRRAQGLRPVAHQRDRRRADRRLAADRCAAAGTGSPAEKHTCAFFFQVIHPEAVSGGAFAQGRDQAANVKAVIEDILGHGNERCLLPGPGRGRVGAGRAPRPAASSSPRPRSRRSTSSPPRRASPLGPVGPRDRRRLTGHRGTPRAGAVTRIRPRIPRGRADRLQGPGALEATARAEPSRPPRPHARGRPAMRGTPGRTRASTRLAVAGIARGHAGVAQEPGELDALYRGAAEDLGEAPRRELEELAKRELRDVAPRREDHPAAPRPRTGSRGRRRGRCRTRRPGLPIAGRSSRGMMPRFSIVW